VASESERVFKTAWFAKAARKAHILDEDLCDAISQVLLGKADDLGGGVFKKRNEFDGISIAVSSWRERVTSGSMNIYSPSRIARILRMMNWQSFAS
jgi:hypothetical protein